MKKKWKIPDLVLIPIASKYQKDLGKTCDNFTTKNFEDILFECGSKYAHVSLDDVRLQCINLRKRGELGSVKETEEKEVIADIPEGMSEYYETNHWIKFSRIVKENWNFRCAICNQKKKLHVFHRTFERKGKELIEDCLPLCRLCKRVAEVRRQRESLKGKAARGEFKKQPTKSGGPFF